MEYINSSDFAIAKDLQDSLAVFRESFYFPQHNGAKCLYFCGNSLGLQPKSAVDFIRKELDNWAEHAVEGHFRIDDPWFSYHERLKEASAGIIGAMPHEVVI